MGRFDYLSKLNLSILGGLALANGILNSTHAASLDVLVFERDTNEYLEERAGYQIRVRLTDSMFDSMPTKVCGVAWTGWNIRAQGMFRHRNVRRAEVQVWCE